LADTRNASRQLDVNQLGNKSSVQLDLGSGQPADRPQIAGLVMQPFCTVADNIFILAVGPQRMCEPV